MALTAAERQKRAKLHRRGDHSLCDPQRQCPAPAPSFGSRGRELWAQMSEELGPAHRVLLVEACRIADRLDRLDQVLADGDWLGEREDRAGRAVLTVDAAMSEARQHATALKAIVAQLERRPTAAAPHRARSNGHRVTDLTARIDARRGPPPA